MSTDKNTSAQFDVAVENEPAATFNVFPPEAPPPPGASKDLLWWIQFERESEREEFANALLAARVFYAFRPDLVTAPHWPADAKAVFMAPSNKGPAGIYDPDVEQHLCIGERSLAPDFEEWVLSEAQKSVRELEAKRLKEARKCRVVCLDRQQLR
jgi:hypothetical protein